MTRLKSLLLVTALALTACGATRAPAPAAPAPGYLATGQPDLLALLPAAPLPGQARYESDRSIFRATRSFAGSPRWVMASGDAQLSSAALLKHFACAMDLQLAPTDAPRTVRLLQRASRDAGREMDTAKEHFKRQRPYWIDAGAICRPRAELGASFDYPSGHAMLGWTWGLLLAQLEPDRAVPLLARGRAIGESRIVCGVHNASAVDAARIAATAVVTLLSAQPQFEHDLAVAQVEMRKLRRTGAPPDARACAEELKLIEIPVG